MGKNNRFTPKEEAFLRDNSDKMTIAEMALSLGRNYYTVQKHTFKLGLRQIHVWTDKEDEKLKGMWGLYKADIIAKRLGVDLNCLYNRIRRLKKNDKWLKNADYLNRGS